MQKLPEHIDEIEAFYRGELEDHEVMPSPALWSNISKNIPSPLGQVVTGTPVRNWIIGSVSGVVALIGVYTYINKTSSTPTITTSKKVEESEIPSNAKNIYIKSTQTERNKKDLSLPINVSSNENRPKGVVELSDKKSTNNQLPISSEQVTLKEEIAEPAIIELVDDTREVDQLQTIPTKSAEVKQELVIPQPSFFEKRASQVKDSARPLFVPKKK